MKALIAALVLLMTGVSTAETKSQCRILVKIDSIMYAGTKDQTVDSVTVCEDGKATGFHSFTAPAFGDAAPQPTKWGYSHEIDKDSVLDLQQFIRRKDIADLHERMNLVRTGSVLYAVMHFQIFDRRKERNITLQAPVLACTDEHPEMPKGALDLVCMFSDLYTRAKTGVSPENGCGCKSLHEMAISP
jgi:hypothetical protein